MKNFFTLAVILSFIPACTSVETWDRRVNVSELSEQDQRLVIDAVNDWNSVCAVNIRFDNSLGSTSFHIRESVQALECPGHDQASRAGNGVSLGGCADIENHNIELLRVDASLMRFTVRHELGHLLGLEHSQNGIMREQSPIDAGKLDSIDCSNL